MENFAWDIVLIMLLLGSLIAIFTGAGLLLVPHKLEKLSLFHPSDRAVPGAGKQFLRPRRFERVFYRHHRLSGAVIFCSALVILYVFLLTDTKQEIAFALSGNCIVFLDTAVAFFIIASVFAAQIGAAVFIRPSMLREIEKVANRLVSFGITFRFLRFFHNVFDGFALRYKRIVAVFFIAGGLYICISAGLMLYHSQYLF